VLKLAADSTTPTELLTHLRVPQGVAVDSAGDLYVADFNRVLKLAAGSTTPTELPFAGLDQPQGVAVDKAAPCTSSTTRDCAQAAGWLHRLGFAPVYRPQRFVGLGGRNCGQCLRRRLQQPSSAETCGRLDDPDHGPGLYAVPNLPEAPPVSIEATLVEAVRLPVGSAGNAGCPRDHRTG
jgi:hypothetical protein